MLWLLACTPPVDTAAPSMRDWVAPELVGADSVIQVPRVRLDDAAVSGATASEWVQRQRGAEPGASWQIVPLPEPSVEFALDVTVRLERCAPTVESGDGSAFGWIGLQTDTGFGGLMVQEGFRVRGWSASPHGPGTGATRVEQGVPIALRLVNEAGRMSLWQDGAFLGDHPHPAHVDFDAPPSDPVLSGLELAGVQCDLHIETLVLSTPRDASTPPERVACASVVRNPDLEGGPAPERWGLQAPTVAALDDAWVDRTLATDAVLVQSLDTPGQGLHVQGDGRVQVTCADGSFELPVPGQSDQVCAGSLQVQALEPTRLDRVTLGGDCAPWPDLETWMPPSHAAPEPPLELGEWGVMQVLATGADGPGVRVHVVDQGLEIHVDAPGPVRGWIDAGGAPVALAFDSSTHVPWTDLDLGPHSMDVWALQLVWGQDAETAALAPRLIDGPLSWRGLWAPADAPNAAHAPLWTDSTAPVSLVLWSGSDLQEDWQNLADQGIGGVSVINPHPNEVGTLAANAVQSGLDLELFNFELHRAWAQGPEPERYAELSVAIAASHAETGQPIQWGLVDEPLYSSLLLCRDELSEAPGDAVPRMAQALEERGCVDSCDATQAWLACLDAWPDVLADLVEELASPVPVSVNLTPDGGVLFDALPGTLSVTNNWVGRHRSHLRRSAPHAALSARDNPTFGYTVLVGPSAEHAWAGAPTATEWRGHAWALLGTGVVGLRHLVWPPADADLARAVGALQHELDTHAVVLGGERAPMRVAPAPLDATAWRAGEQWLVAVTNPTDRPIQGRVETPDGQGVDVTLAPWAAVLLQSES
jgi:hypothetical protein